MGSRGEPVGSGARQAIALRYASAAAARRDQLHDVATGLLVKVRAALAPGERVDVAIELGEERVTLRAEGVVRWATPLVSGALAGVELLPGSHRVGVQLDVLFGRRTAGPAPEPAPAGGARVERERTLSVAMLQPNPVFRRVLAQALERLGREEGGWAVRVEAVGDADAFLAALSAGSHALAVVDCDPLGAAVEPLVHAVRSHVDWQRLPIILLVSSDGYRVDDPLVTLVRKPVATRTFVDLARMLVAAA